MSNNYNKNEGWRGSLSTLFFSPFRMLTLQPAKEVMSDIIKLLPDHVANQIAAGEVIQRPASVVKELLENAIDAGSTDITLVIKEGGKTFIQVIDNGKGMSPSDARMCWERHATSKIAAAEDIYNVKTMGFRG
jgi:DNA mismatch repair protein MutL